MKGDSIFFRDGYRYQLVESYQMEIPVHPEEDIITEWLLLNRKGFLSIMRGYAWDGPSGPMPDFSNAMRGSLVHDALYQLIRIGRLDATYRDTADKLLRTICLEDGMSHPFAELVYQGVHLFGNPYADPASEKPVIEAP
jgi:hypothetical protein